MTYQEILESTEITELNKILPVVKRVHSDNHPELVSVNDIYNNLKASLNDNSSAEKIKELIESLNKLTNGFTVPDDACPTFEKTYKHLKAITQYIEKA